MATGDAAGVAVGTAVTADTTVAAGTGTGTAFACRRALRSSVALLSSTSERMSTVVIKNVAPEIASFGGNLLSSAREITLFWVRKNERGRC